jgi:CBS domain-containing protein/nucleotide-binding universal stress UspA family protein
MTQAFRTILSPIDFDANSLGALQTAAELARSTGATIFVLHVVTPPGPGPTRSQLDSYLAGEHGASERLKVICRDRLGDLRYEIVTRTGDPAIAIIRTAEEVKADLVVIATHANRGRWRAFAGSVAERVIRESICPVVSVRPSAAGDPDAVGVHMTLGPVTISPDTPVALVRQMMARGRLRCIPVLQNDQLVGIVTDRDIAFSDPAPTATTGDLMTRDLVIVAPRTSIQEAARLLVECEVDALPVVEDQKLLGIITRSDILKGFTEMAKQPSP